MHKACIKVLALLALFALPALSQSINPATQITWPNVTGSGAPAITCTASNYGQPYTDTANNVAYFCTASGWVKTNTGGFPTATQPGQVPTSLAAGTTYAVQGQVFYSQAGDTVASIEAECSSLCTYISTIPQTITLAASHTLSSNVHLLFYNGGKWTVNGTGFILTIPSQVQGALSRHFGSGTGSVKFGALQAEVPVEWFGAVGDWNGTTGTDNTVAINAAIASLTNGNAVLSGAAYEVTGTLSVTASNTGIIGTVKGNSTSGNSALIETTAAADVIECNNAATTPASSINYNTFHDFTIQRTVIPTGTATGLKLNFCAGADVKHVDSFDSIRGFYFQGVPSAGLSSIAFNNAGWDYYNGGWVYTVPLYGYYVDSSNGYGMNSGVFESNNADTPKTAAQVDSSPIYGFYLTGTHVADVFFRLSQCTYLSFCAYINSTGAVTGGGGPPSQDVHFYDSVFDACVTTCFYVTGFNAGNPSLTIDGGFYSLLDTNNSNSHVFDFESSSSIVVSNTNDWSVMGFEDNSGDVFHIVNTPNVTLTGNWVNGNNCTTGVGALLVSGGGSDTIVGNQFLEQRSGPCGEISQVVKFANSSNNSFTGNSILGEGVNAIVLDATSQNNISVQANNIHGTFTTPISDAGTGNQTTTSLIAGSGISLSPASGVGAVTISATARIAGIATLVSGTATVSNAAACVPSSTCVYKLANCGLNASTAVGVPTVGTVTAGTSFVVNSESATATVVTGDASTVCWAIN